MLAAAGNVSKIFDPVRVSSKAQRMLKAFGESLTTIPIIASLSPARRWAEIFETRMGRIDPEQRRMVLAEFAAALAHD
jgi:hypothetical protein